jgi:DHA1 family bicyclomycin/chloramphenicol resistance-like MFS transporter
VFFVQSVIGAIVFIGAVVFRETIREKNEVSVIGALSRLALLMRHGRFAVMIILFSLPGACIMAYVSASTYIYQDHFGLNSYQYSLFFGICAVGAIAGPAIYMAASARLSRFSVVLFCFAAIMAVGVVAFVAVERSPIYFAALRFALALLGGMTRPAGAYLIMNYHDGNAGSASSLMSATVSFMGSVGMAIVTIHPRYILVIGVVSVVVGITSAVVWIVLSRRYDVR